MSDRFLFLLLLLPAWPCISQPIPADCTVTEEVRQYYSGDAEILAVELMQMSPLSEQLAIEPSYVETALQWLASVYHATALPARDTVVNCLHIHRDTLVHSLRLVEVWVDSSTLWAQNLAAGIVPTGHPEVDSLIDGYGLEVVEYHFLSFNNTHDFVLQASQRLNTPALTRRFMQIQGVVDATNQISFAWGWQDIWFEFPPVDTYVVVVYQHCWGDDVCGYTRRWKFGVSVDCSQVSFLGSEGHLLPPNPCVTPAHQRPSFLGSVALYPVPADQWVHVEIDTEVNTKGTLRLLTLHGLVLEEHTRILGQGQSQKISLDLSQRPDGVYLLHLTTDAGSWFAKIAVHHSNR